MPTTSAPDLELSSVFRQYRDPIQRYARSLVRDRAEAEQIAQETFLRCISSFPGFVSKVWANRGRRQSTVKEETEMCETKQGEEKRHERSTDEPQSRNRCGCSCRPEHCRRVAGGLLAVLAVGLVIGAVRRSRQKRDSEANGRRPAGCCA